MGFVLAYSILGRYVHKYCILLTHEEVFGVWSTMENKFADECVGGPQGAVLVILTYKEVYDGV